MRKRSIPTLLEHMAEAFDGYLYHATAAQKRPAIQADGLGPLSYWATPPVHAYYLEEIRDEGDIPHAIRVPIGKFDPALLEPDFPGLDEPLTFTLGVTEEQIWQAWSQTDKSWHACLSLIGSVRYRGLIRI